MRTTAGERPKRLAVMMVWMVCLAVLLSVVPWSASATDGLLPAPGFAEGWAIDGKIVTYTKENLYKYINGEAELYLPYGFETLTSALYKKVGDVDTGIVADVYAMGSLIDAFGIYSNYRRPEAEEIKIGAQGFVGSTQLMFYKDRYFVQLNESGDSSPTREAFLSCAEAIAKRLPGDAARPKELELFKVPGVIPQTEKYLSQSLLGYEFFGKGFTAEATLDGEPVRIFIVLGESEKDAVDKLGRYISYLKQSGTEPRISKDNRGATIVTAQDPLYKGTIIRQSASYLFGAIKLKDPSKGILLLDRFHPPPPRP
jgi:hypothetical protein